MTDTTADVRRWLTAIPDMAALLPDALTTRAHGEKISRPVPASKPPVNLALVDLLDTRGKHDWKDGSMAWCDPDRMGVLPYLDGWVRDLEATAYDGDVVFGIAPLDPPPPDAPETPTVAGLCSWLAGILDWAETLPQWPDLVDGIRVMHGRLRAATASVRDVEERPVPCRFCNGGTLVRVDGRAAAWECDLCGHPVTVQAVTVNQAAEIIGIPKHKLYAIVNRPALLGDGVAAPKPILGETGSRRLYDLNDLRRVTTAIRYRSLKSGA